jgi:O-acetyl-ADP-ribose deacetylase (regulator of RNase III)
MFLKLTQNHMSRGGCRSGAGAKPKWKHSETKTIRVPIAIADQVLEIAKMIDQGSRENALEPNLPGSSIGSVLKGSKELSSTKGVVRQSKSSSSIQLVLGDSPNFNLPILSELDFQEMVRKTGIEGLYYIVHIENLASILKIGILSHRQIAIQNIEHVTIYDSDVIDRRSNRAVIEDKTLWDFANLYLQPRNAMLYSITHKIGVNDIAIVSINKEILKARGAFITTGNAAGNESAIIPVSEAKSFLSQIRKEIDKDWWNRDDGSKRKMMAECLVPDLIPSSYIQGIYVATNKAKTKAESKIAEVEGNLQVVVEPERFFLPNSVASVTKRLSVARGDMFFSKMQTLTISVNCVGVMGKGLASAAKYRFPDVYVKYEDMCKKKTLKLGQPYIHKRESSVLSDLGDEAFMLADVEDASQTWFMLFPTKGHWKNNSRLEDIEQGLRWFSDNYKKQGVKSVAFPALGCGNGGLSWRDVGPLMCKYLAPLELQVVIYLPAEIDVPQEWTSSKFLLSQI